MKSFYVGAAKFFEFECPNELVELALDKAKECEYNHLLYDNGITVGYQKQDDGSYVSLYDEKLYDWLTDCANQVANTYFKNHKLKICDLWVVKSKFGNVAKTHLHGYSLFSGLLYLTSCTRSETVFYYKDHFLNRWEFFLGDTFIGNRNIVHKVTPEKGKLLIWPSDIEHSVNPHTNKDDRYTIAFNTFIEGKISNFPTARLDINVGGSQSESFIFDLGKKK